jgi:ribose 5-phosphate isomerase A
MVVIAQASKQVRRLGAFPLPVEVVRFGRRRTQDAIAEAIARFNVGGREIVLRERGGVPVVTEEGHHILDLRLQWIEDPSALAAALNAIPGVVDHGLFLGIAERVIFGREDGSVTELGGPPAQADPEDTDAVVESMRNQDA